MKTKKWLGLVLAGVGGYILWKRRQATQATAFAINHAVNDPLTEPELEQFSPLDFRRGEACPR